MRRCGACTCRRPGGARRLATPTRSRRHALAKELASGLDSEIHLLHIIEQPTYPVFYDAVSTPVVIYSPELEAEIDQREQQRERLIEDHVSEAVGEKLDGL